MKIIVTLLGLAISLPGWGEETIMGNYHLKMGKQDNTVEVNLNCDSPTNCLLLTTSESNGKTIQSMKALPGVHPLENLEYARNAVEYVLTQKEVKLEHAEYAETMDRLRPFLNKGTQVNKCWDLNYEYPNFMIVCTLSTASQNDKFLFGTLMGGCGEGFCRYIINPLDTGPTN